MDADERRDCGEFDFTSGKDVRPKTNPVFIGKDLRSSVTV
jgi:hypothetical protein